MRTFIALEIPEEFANQTAAVARVLSERIKGRVLARDTYHITLAFLGELDHAQDMRAMDALDAACEDAGPIVLRATEIGKFGKSHDATVWMGLHKADELMELATRVRKELTDAGVPFDAKPFVPHLTLMRRAKIPRSELPASPFPEDTTTTRVTLFKSELTPSGATYTALHEVTLG